MRKKITSLCFLLVLVIGLAGCGKEIEVKNGSKVAVSLGDEKFTATEYYEKIKEKNIIELINMMDKAILEKKYQSTDDETDSVNKQIEQIKQYYGENEEKYMSVLQSYFGVDSEKQLIEQLRLEYKRKLAVEDYLKEKLSDKEIENYYNNNISGEVSAKHILITADVTSDATDKEKEEAEKKALEKAKDIIKKLNNGEDFSKLAKKNSQDKATATNGGDLGYFSLDKMVSEFSNALKELKVDEYTKEPVKTEFGYHIILKTGEKDKPKLEEVKETIKTTLVNDKLNENTATYYETLIEVRKENKLSWNDSELEKAYNEYMEKLIKNATANS